MVQTKEAHWELIQAKTFTKWCNDKLNKGGFPTINNIYCDFHDGVALGNLLRCLLNIDIRFNKKPFTRIQKVENLEILLKIIKKQGQSLVNIGPEDIVDCNKKLILGLTWTLISKLSISELGVGDLSMKEELLRWCKIVTKDYKNVKILDLTKSWQDGLGFNAIIHKFRPDLIPNYDELDAENAHFNLEQAFDIADRKLKISRLLDIEDVVNVVRPDEKSMITYLSEYYKKFKQFETEQIAKKICDGFLNKIEWSLQSRNFYEMKIRSFLNKQKMYLEKKKELSDAFDKVRELQNELQTMNSGLSSDFMNIHSLSAEIKMLHDHYNLKTYIPPKDISIDKIDFVYDDIHAFVAQSLNIKTIENEGKTFNEQLKKMKSMLLSTCSIIEKLNYLSEIKSWNIVFLKAYITEDYSNLENTFVKFNEFVSFLNNEDKNKEAVIKKAISMYDFYNSKVTINEFKIITKKLAIVIDSDTLSNLEIENAVIPRNRFVDIITRALNKSYDATVIKNVLSTLKENVQLNEKEHKNLLCYNGKNEYVNVLDLADEFLN